MFKPSRDQARQFLFSTWEKFQTGQALEGAETLALEAMIAHPEYHPLLNQPDRYLDKDYTPESGETNPFLHLSMHMAIAEQLSVDQPRGVRSRYEQLLKIHGDPMLAQHEVMDCLAEMIWQSQRHGGQYNPAIYFDCMDRKIANP